MIKFEYNGSYVQAQLSDDSVGALKKDFPSDVVDEAVKQAKWVIVRAERDRLISQCDWTQMPDAPLDEAKKAEFTAYRQALRDIPQTYSDPDAVVWPEKPTV